MPRPRSKHLRCMCKNCPEFIGPIPKTPKEGMVFLADQQARGDEARIRSRSIRLVVLNKFATLDGVEYVTSRTIIYEDGSTKDDSNPVKLKTVLINYTFVANSVGDPNHWHFSLKHHNGGFMPRGLVNPMATVGHQVDTGTPVLQGILSALKASLQTTPEGFMLHSGSLGVAVPVPAHAP